MWKTERHGEYEIYAMVYRKPSSKGMEGGRVLKLTIRRVPRGSLPETVLRYDRGWVVKPSCEDAEVLMRDFLSRHEKKAPRRRR